MTLVMVYVLFCVAVYVYPEAFFYGPSSEKSDIAKARQNGYPAEEVSFKSADGTELPAWYTKPGKQNKIVVFMHGNSYNVEKFYNKMIPFVKAGYGTFMPEYRRSRMIGRLFQDPLKGTAPHMTIEENLALAYLRASKHQHAFFSRTSKADRKFFRERLAQLDMGLEEKTKAFAKAEVFTAKLQREFIIFSGG